LTYGEPALQEYQFNYSLPKNYSCETVNQKKGNFGVAFMFAIRVVLKSGHILTKTVPVTLFRVAPTKPAEQDEEEPDEEQNNDDK